MKSYIVPLMCLMTRIEARIDSVSYDRPNTVSDSLETIPDSIPANVTTRGSVLGGISSYAFWPVQRMRDIVNWLSRKATDTAESTLVAIQSAYEGEKSTLVAIESAEDFLSRIHGHSVVIIKFGAKWCHPCKRLIPFINQLSEEHNTLAFYEVDVDELPDLTSALGVESFPTFLIYKNKVKIGQLVGPSEDDLHKMIEEKAY